MKVLSAAQIYEADKITVEKQGINSIDLMERAGTKVFQWLIQNFKGSSVPFHIFCGTGNNGGDGLVVGRLLIEHGHEVIVYLVNTGNTRSSDFLQNYNRFKKINKVWPILLNNKTDFPEINPEDIIIDAIFGIGLTRAPDGWIKELIQHLNQNDAFKLAIDIPSGLFADQAIKDENAVLKADVTLTFQVPKLAFFLPESGKFVPHFEILDIGLDLEFIESSQELAKLIFLDEVRDLYLPRKKFDHKGIYGHALIIGGSYGKIGAAVLSTKAALKMGAGMVTAFVPKCGYNILQTTVPEAMVITDKEAEFITHISTDFEPSAIGMGMGMGKNKASAQALRNLFETVKCPIVVDADALNIISENTDILKSLPKNAILTPHPGELKRLIGPWSDDCDKLEKVKAFSKKHDVVVLIKGAYTATVFQCKVYINTSGNPGMATAGSGDVLTGIITGLLCQGYSSLNAAVFGVFMHGFAGDLASMYLGFESIMAQDIIHNLSAAFLKLYDDREPEPEVFLETT